MLPFCVALTLLPQTQADDWVARMNAEATAKVHYSVGFRHGSVLG